MENKIKIIRAVKPTHFSCYIVGNKFNTSKNRSFYGHRGTQKFNTQNIKTKIVKLYIW